MNIEILKKHLGVFRKCFKTNKSQALSEQTERELLATNTQSYTKERLQAMSEDDLFDNLAPLWAMAM